MAELTLLLVFFVFQLKQIWVQLSGTKGHGDSALLSAAHRRGVAVSKGTSLLGPRISISGINITFNRGGNQMIESWHRGLLAEESTYWLPAVCEADSNRGKRTHLGWGIQTAKLRKSREGDGPFRAFDCYIGTKAVTGKGGGTACRSRVWTSSRRGPRVGRLSICGVGACRGGEA